MDPLLVIGKTRKVMGGVDDVLLNAGNLLEGVGVST